MASDAFFPFADGPELAIQAGVAAIIQPGGSTRDAEVIEACEKAAVPMVFTSRRHFRTDRSGLQSVGYLRPRALALLT